MKGLNPAAQTFNKTLLAIAITSCITVGVIYAQEDGYDYDYGYDYGYGYGYGYGYIPEGFTPEEIQEYYKERREALNLLGIKEDFPSEKVIKKAFRDFSLKNHPDKHSGDKEKYHVLMQQAGDAKEGLLEPHIDEERRQRIDKSVRIMKNNPQAGSYWEGVSETEMDFFYEEEEEEDDDGTPTPQNTQSNQTAAILNITAQAVPASTPTSTPVHTDLNSDIYQREMRAAALESLHIIDNEPSREEVLKAFEELSNKTAAKIKARDFLLGSSSTVPASTVTQTSAQANTEITPTISTTDSKATPTETIKSESQSRSYASRVYNSIFGRTSLQEDAPTETVSPTSTEAVSRTENTPPVSTTAFGPKTEAETLTKTGATPTDTPSTTLTATPTASTKEEIKPTATQTETKSQGPSFMTRDYTSSLNQTSLPEDVNKTTESAKPTATVNVQSTTSAEPTPQPTPNTTPNTTTVLGPKAEAETLPEAPPSEPSYLSRVYASLFNSTSTPENKEIQEDKEAAAIAEKTARRAEYERLSKNNPQEGSYQEGLEHTYLGKPLPEEESQSQPEQDQDVSPVNGKETADKLKANNPQGGSYHVGVDHEFTGQPLENYTVYGPELEPVRKAALQLLGLTDNASPSEAEIKHAFREYAKTHHPDKCEDQKACTEAFYAATEAKNYLLGINQDEDKTVHTADPVEQIAGPEISKEDEEAAANAKAEAEEAERKRQEKEKQRQEQERLHRQIEEASTINETSKVGKQVKTMYAAGLVQSLSTQSTAAMSHHGIAMNSFHNTHMLANVQLEDLNTGEMLASAGEHTLNKQLIQEGGLYSYGQIYGFKMNQGKVDNLAGFDANGYGLEVGVFKQLNSEWSAGLMIGIQKMSSSFKDSQGSIKASNLRIGPFASWNKDQWHFNTALTYGITDMDSKRRDPVFGQEYKASPKANEWTAYASLGYDINMDNVATGLVLTPNVEVLYINSSIDGFKEKGQGDSALKVDSQNRTHLITRTGLQMSYLIPDSELPREFRLGVGYQKSLLDDSPIKVGYVDQGSMQQLKTGSYGKDAIYYNAGYSMALKDHQNLHIDYFGSTGKSSQSHALALTYEMKF